jgi:hypothetical protein
MRLMEKAGVHDPIRLLRWAILRGYVKVERVPAGANIDGLGDSPSPD